MEASANAAGELTGCESQQAELAAVNSLLAISQVIQSGGKAALDAERGLSPSSDAQRELLVPGWLDFEVKELVRRSPVQRHFP